MGPSIALLRMNEWTSSQAYLSDILKSLQKLYWALRCSQAQQGPAQQSRDHRCPLPAVPRCWKVLSILGPGNLICSSTRTWAEAIFSFCYDKLKWKLPVAGCRFSLPQSVLWLPGVWVLVLTASCSCLVSLKAGRNPAGSQATAKVSPCGGWYQLYFLKMLFQIRGRQTEKHCQSFPPLKSYCNNQQGTSTGFTYLTLSTLSCPSLFNQLHKYPPCKFWSSQMCKYVIHWHSWLNWLPQIEFFKYQGGGGGGGEASQKARLCLSHCFLAVCGHQKSYPYKCFANRQCRCSLPCSSEADLPNAAALSSPPTSHLHYQFFLIEW